MKYYEGLFLKKKTPDRSGGFKKSKIWRLGLLTNN